MQADKTKNILYIMVSKGVAFGVGIVRGLLVPGYLGPRLYGVIGLLKLVQVIQGFSSFGMDQAYIRLSLEHKNKAPEKKRMLEDNVFTFLLVSAIIGTVITAALPFIMGKDDMEIHHIMVFCFAVAGIQHFFQLTGNFFYQSVYIEKRFKVISAMNMLQPLMSLGLILATVFHWKIFAVFISDLISVIFVQMWYFKVSRIHPNIKIHWDEFKKTFKYAWPFFVSMICFYLYRFTDRTVIAAFLTLEDLGLYTFAIGIAETTRLLCVSVGEVSIPSIVEEISKTEEIVSISGKAIAFTNKMVLISTIVSLTCIFLCPFIFVILPKYSKALVPLIILLINNFSRTFQLYQTLLLSSPRINRQNHLNAAMGITGVLNLGMSLYLVKHGYGIIGIVVANFVSHIVMTVFYFIASQKYYLTSGRKKYYAKIFFALGVLVVFAVLQQMDSGVSARNFILDMITFALLSGALIVVYRKDADNIAARLFHMVKSS